MYESRQEVTAIAAMPDWQPMRLAKMRERGAIILHAPTSTSRAQGTLPVDPAGLRILSDHLGLAILSRSALLRAVPFSNVLAILSPRGNYHVRRRQCLLVRGRME